MINTEKKVKKKVAKEKKKAEWEGVNEEEDLGNKIKIAAWALCEHGDGDAQAEEWHKTQALLEPSREKWAGYLTP